MKTQSITSTTLSFQHFGPFTYISVDVECERVKIINEKKKRVGKVKQHASSVCVTTKLYEKHKNDPYFFIERLKHKHTFQAVSEQYLGDYISGTHWKTEDDDRYVDTLQALKDGDFDRVVCDMSWEDHTFRDHNNNIIYHNISFHGVNNVLRESDYDIDGLRKHLGDREDVVDIKEMYLPHWAASKTGEIALEFTYVPSKWEEFVSWYYPDSLSGKYDLLEKLGVEDFRRE